MRERLDQAIKRFFQLFDRIICVALRDCICNAVVDMMFKNPLRGGIQRGTDSGNLCQHFCTLPAIIPEPLQAGCMPGDPRQTLCDVILDWFQLDS